MVESLRLVEQEEQGQQGRGEEPHLTEFSPSPADAIERGSASAWAACQWAEYLGPDSV